MRARDRLKVLNAFELSVEWFLPIKRRAPDDFDRAIRAKPDVARQPHLAITATADFPQQFVVGDGRSRNDGVLDRWGIRGWLHVTAGARRLSTPPPVADSADSAVSRHPFMVGDSLRELGRNQ